MAINTSGILKSPQGSAIQNAEIIFEQTRTSTEVLAGTKFSVITNQTGNYSSSLGVGTYVFKVRFQDETQYRTVASNVIVTQSMNNYSLNQIIQDQSQLQDVDYNLLQDVIQARDQAAASKQAAQSSQAAASTKASEASSSAQAALASKNAAQTSEANALASKNAAQTSQTNAASSQTAAANSQTAAANSQTTATTKASEASSSAQAALASKNAAQTSETNALSSKNAAQTSQTNAAGSQTAASTSQTTASTKAGEASTSQTNASNSQTTATTKAGEASTSQTNAAASQTTATTKAGEASTSQTNAAASQSTATTKATEAANSTALAQKWAANPENSVVSGGLYSALHYAAKAAQSAQTASGQLVWRGGWSAQAGSAPPTPSGATQDFYRITQAGTILSVQYEVGDYIHWDNLNSIWFKMDGTDAVTSVNGRTGAVVVTKTDVGLSAVNNWAASSQTNDASTTTYATTAGVKAAYDLAATKLAATANAVSATKLVTARTINGTSFDGTANITTQNWGTSRSLTIGETSKAVNGSADISWTLNEIGAAPAGFGLGGSSPLVNTKSGFFAQASPGQQGYPSNGAGFQSTYNDNRRAQLYVDTGGLVYSRFSLSSDVVDSATQWAVHYTSLNKPTAAELSVVPDTRTVNGKRLNANIAITSEDVDTYTKQVIDEQSLKTVTVQAPQGVVAGKYYPIVVSNYGSDHSLFVETRSSGGADPMNYCSFDGQIHNGGWSDTGGYVYGQFTIYSSNERQIHSILGSAEAQTAYAIYVEARAFPVNVRVRASANVACTGLDMSYGTTVFAQAVTNPQGGVGTKTKLLAEFQPGNHFYSSNTMICRAGVETQSTIVVNKDRTDVGSLVLGGDTYAYIAGKAVGQSGYNYDEGLRYYNDNTWRIGNKKILHDGGGTLLGQLSTTFNNAAPIILDRGTQVGIGYRHSATQTQYLGVDDTGSLRFGPNLSHATNQYVYTTDRKPTAADTGAVARSFIPLGQTLDLNSLRSGQHLRLEQGNYTNGPSDGGTDYAQVLHVNGQGDTHVQILGTYNTRKLYWRGFNNSSASGSVPWSQIYHTEFKPTPADIGALQAGATAVAATKLATARTIGGVAFDGTANINLPGVNTAGNQSTTGNAATATKLETARTIGGVAFDGTANINLPGVNIAGNQSTTGNAATATKLATAITLTMGGTGKAFDGTANLSWSLSEIGAAQAMPLNLGSTGGKPRSSRLLSIGKTDNSCSFIISSQGDFGNRTRGWYQISVATRGNVITVDAYSINAKDSADPLKLFTVDTGSVFEVWGEFSDYNNDSSVLICSSHGAIFWGDQMTSAKDWTGFSQIEINKIYTSTDKPTAADIGAVDKAGDTMTGNLTTPKVLVSDAQGTEVNALTRKDYVDGLAASKLGSTTNTVWNATGAGAGQGLAYSGKTAIGGVNDSWLRINPNSEFTSGIYCGASLLRTDGSFSVNDYSPTRRSIRLAQGVGGTWAADKIAFIDLGGAPTTGSTATHLLRYKDTAGATIFALETLDQGGLTYLRAGTGNYQFNTNGEFNASGNGNFNDVYIRSDKRLKSNLVKLDSALDRVGQLQAYSYDKHKSLTDRTVVAREVGLVAQDVMVVIPEAVKAVSHQISGTTTEEVLTISSSAINAVLVEALKELMEKVTALEARIKEVENVGT